MTETLSLLRSPPRSFIASAVGGRSPPDRWPIDSQPVPGGSDRWRIHRMSSFGASRPPIFGQTWPPTCERAGIRPPARSHTPSVAAQMAGDVRGPRSACATW